MDDLYWLAKAVRQLNATTRKIASVTVRAPTNDVCLNEVMDDLDKVNACLGHIDAKVVRG